ncbi:DUF7144 family membrane protein [Actinorhabdospora filicis]|uniref:DUF7144 family membrane protein n=1 Tax=Actinorhabdospora filicis TaxID=1785913 RepID=UPI00255626F2|nr:hypothetical protein [Actinorhabdospora filicis]
MAGNGARNAWSIGGATFAGCMMVMLGIWQVLIGIAAIAKDGFFVVGANYLYEFNTAGWGWLHLIIGALSAIAGFFVFTGASWARGVGIGLAVVSATVQFFWLPYEPIWALVVIALDIFVIWALMTMGQAMADDERAEAREAAQWNDQGTRDWQAANRARPDVSAPQAPPVPPSGATPGMPTSGETPPRH